MIKSKRELCDFLSRERIKYIKESDLKNRFIANFCQDKDVVLWKYQRLLRLTEYHYNLKAKSLYHSLMYAYYRRKKNIKGTRLGIEIWENTFDVGLRIHHAGNIVVNGMARVGKNCQLHGSNCIGNDGKTLDAPIVGNNVNIGVGAKIIGGITIADNIKIAAGAVVISSFAEKGITIGGVPARKLK